MKMKINIAHTMQIMPYIEHYTRMYSLGICAAVWSKKYTQIQIIIKN